ncbi:MAG: hypothetical protein AAGF50_12300, partial [Pseudomonadota bacterium]
KSSSLTVGVVISLVILAVGFPAVIGSMVDKNVDLWSLSLFAGFLLFLVFNAITIVLWNRSGREIVTFARGVITVERRMPYLVKRRAFPVGTGAQIRVAHELPDRVLKWWSFFVHSPFRTPYEPFPFLGGFQRGKIQFAYQSVSFRSFGLDLTTVEAENLLDRIRNLRGWGAPSK